MRSLFSVFLTVVAVAVLAAGCKESPTTNNTALHESKGIMPLKVGNHWFYQNTEYDTNGNFEETDESYPYEISREITLGGEIWYPVSADLYYLNRPDGLWSVDRAFHDSSLIAPYPAELGDLCDFDTLLTYPQWVAFDSVVSCWRVEDKAATVDVIAGRFTCYQYHRVYRNFNGVPLTLEERKWHGVTTDEDYYYAPNVGLVLHERLGRRFDGSIYTSSRRELREYELK